MKQIGRLDDGLILVECSVVELNAYKVLAEVAKGNSLQPYYAPERGILDAELSGVLNAISEWLEIKDRANWLRELAGRIDKAIKDGEH